MTTLLVMGGAAVGMVLLTAVAVIRMQRSLDRPGGRQGLGSVGDAFGNFIDVFPRWLSCASCTLELRLVHPSTPYRRRDS